MRFEHVLKYNRYQGGYAVSWPGGRPGLEKEVVEESLPPLEGGSPGLAYSATRLPDGRALLVVGCHWPQHSDEFGRTGISYWHGLLCEAPPGGERGWTGAWERRLGGLLAVMARRYEAGFYAIGEHVAQAARSPQEGQAAGGVYRLMDDAADRPGGADADAEAVLEAIEPELAGLAPPANLRVDYPLHAGLAIPCLFALLRRQRGPARVAGGALAAEKLRPFPYISAPEEVAGYRTVDVASLCRIAPADAPADPALPEPPPTAGPTADGRLSGLAALVLGLVATVLAVLAFRIDRQAHATRRELAERGRELAEQASLLDRTKDQLALARQQAESLAAQLADARRSGSSLGDEVAHFRQQFLRVQDLLTASQAQLRAKAREQEELAQLGEQAARRIEQTKAQLARALGDLDRAVRERDEARARHGEAAEANGELQARVRRLEALLGRAQTEVVEAWGHWSTANAELRRWREAAQAQQKAAAGKTGTAKKK